MPTQRYAHITGWGMSVPERVLTNDELARTVDTTNEWIVGRTGIRERRIAGPKESTATLAIAAARVILRLDTSCTAADFTFRFCRIALSRGMARPAASAKIASTAIISSSVKP